MTDRETYETFTRPEHLPGAGGAWVAAIIVVAISLLSTFTIATPDDEDQAAIGYVDPGSGQIATAPADPTTDATAGDTVRRVGGTTGDQVVAGSQGSSTGGTGTEGVSGTGGAGTYDCAKGQNAGSSDVGVTGDSIRFGATVVLTDIAKDFLADAQWGIKAVIQKINQKGGVCGRRIVVDMQDDGWNSGTGTTIINKWIGGEDHFGLAVNPSSEGLRGAIDGGHIEANQFPVVGADGMLINQYLDAPWVWPVATSTYSVGHIMAREAYERGLQELGRKPKFAVVWDHNYKFGEEGHGAFVNEVKRLCGGDSCFAGKAVDQPLKAGSGPYKAQAETFIGACGNNLENCDFIALFLEPATALQWVRDGGLGQKGSQRPKVGIGAPQPLFVDSFIRNCDERCANLWAWTSFKPNLFPYDQDPAVKQYVADVRAVSSSADINNPHVQGAYVGAMLLVDALEKLGPAPTRVALRAALDQTTFDSGLAPPLQFSPGKHFAATQAQAFQAIFNGNDFNSWQHVKGFTADQSVDKLSDIKS